MNDEPQDVKSPYSLALQTLVGLLKSPDENIRFAAAQALLTATSGRERGSAFVDPGFYGTRVR